MDSTTCHIWRAQCYDVVVQFLPTEAMKHVVKFSLVVMLLAAPAALAQKPASGEEGKAILVSRCAKCHDTDANRKLPLGTTLMHRLGKSQAVSEVLSSDHS